MAAVALEALGRAIAALTYDEIEHVDAASGETLARDDGVPLLQRSIAQDLRDIEGRLGLAVNGQTILSAIESAIDEALLAVAEAQSELGASPGARR